LLSQPIQHLSSLLGLFMGLLLSFSSVSAQLLQEVPSLAPPREAGVRITEVVVDGGTKAASWRASYVELAYVNNDWPRKPALSLAGWKLQSSAGGVYIFPAGTSLAPGEFLVVDLSFGLAGAKMPPNCGAQLKISKFRGNFFGADLKRREQGSLALKDKSGNFVDFVRFRKKGLASKLDLLSKEAIEHGEWPSAGDVELSTFQTGELGFYRRHPLLLDTNFPDQWHVPFWNGWLSPGSPRPWTGEERRIEGIVTDEKGEPLAGVAVFEPSTKTKVWTQADGAFVMDGFGQGSWNLKMTKKGYLPYWTTVLFKMPYEKAAVSRWLVPLTQCVHVEGTIGAQGGSLSDPKGLILLRFPKGFYTRDTHVKVDWAPGNPNGSRWMQSPAYDRAFGRKVWGGGLMASGGNLQISPEGGGKGQVQIRLRIPKAEKALYKNAKRLIPAYIQKDGSAGRMPLGTNHWSGQDFVMEFRVSHFCQYEALVPGETLMEGWTGLQLESEEHTMDLNGDGKIDAKDRPMVGCEICPKGACHTSTSEAYGVALETSSGITWNFGIELSIKKILTVSGGREKQDSRTKKSSWTAIVKATADHPYDLETKYGEPSDKKEWVLFYMRFKKLTFVDHFIHKNPLKKKSEKKILLIPEGLGFVHSAIGDCFPKKKAGVRKKH
jgi:hypothetical protein